METYGYVLIVIAFGSFVLALLSLVVQIIVAINRKK
ncbi:putative holin-like toxin [Halalkalibacillus sediminis]|nr:putative holin-like toxin [Halalkalibacillus sediminis]